MKRILTLLFFPAFFHTAAMAQDNGQNLLTTLQEVRGNGVETAGVDSNTDRNTWTSTALVPPLQDSLHLPELTLNGTVRPFAVSPLWWGNWNSWELHEGMNLNLGISVFAQFGKNAQHGAGFTQNLAALYAMPLTDKLTLAAGGYMNNIFWQHDTYRDAGLTAILGYRFNEHWEAYLYGQKSIVTSSHTPWALYDMHELGDKVGAAVKYNFTPSFSVQVSFEQGRLPHQRHVWNDMPENWTDRQAAPFR